MSTQAHEATDAAQQGTEHTATLDAISDPRGHRRVDQHRQARRAVEPHYTVRSGDTLSTIAKRFYDNASDWGYIYHENAEDGLQPEHDLRGRAPRTSRPPLPAALQAVRLHAEARRAGRGDGDGHRPSTTRTATAAPQSGGGTVVVQSGKAVPAQRRASGTLGCSGLEQLWDAAGGNPADAFMAAEIAMAESGGNQYALSPTDDYGYWQINASNGALATFNAYENARSAIILSDDGTNWDPWTTYREGLYEGKC